MPEISVIICTHNPRPEYLAKVLDALKTQTMDKESWELLLVDNASREPLAGKWDLSWHPNGRHVREEELGLTAARLRGIREAKGELLIFVDDDNVLASNYLEQSLVISREWSVLGAWGGRSLPAFESPPAGWTKPYWKYLALHDFVSPSWGNLASATESFPCGAGMCVRQVVAEKFRQEVMSDRRKKQLGRKGTSLFSQEDFHMVYSAIEAGLGFGRFPQLMLTHLIPDVRLTESYLERLLEADSASSVLLRCSRGNYLPPSALGKIKRRLKLLFLGGRDRRFYRAALRGEQNGVKIARELLNAT